MKREKKIKGRSSECEAKRGRREGRRGPVREEGERGGGGERDKQKNEDKRRTKETRKNRTRKTMRRKGLRGIKKRRRKNRTERERVFHQQHLRTLATQHNFCNTAFFSPLRLGS